MNVTFYAGFGRKEPRHRQERVNVIFISGRRDSPEDDAQPGACNQDKEYEEGEVGAPKDPGEVNGPLATGCHRDLVRDSDENGGDDNGRADRGLSYDLDRVHVSQWTLYARLFGRADPVLCPNS